MADNLSVGIDIGSYQTKVVATTNTQDGSTPPIRGTGYATSQGLRHGYVTDTPVVTEQVKEAIQQASESAGQPIERAYLSIGGVSLRGNRATNTIEFNDPQHKITEADIETVVEKSKQALTKKQGDNRTVLDQFPLAFKVDGRTTMGRPTGLKGQTLSVHTLFITAISQHVYDLVESVEEAGVAVDDIMASPLAAAEVSLTDAQKIAGCVLVNIGSQTTSVLTFDDNEPISLEVFPIGSTDITNDIALGLQIPLEKAEQIKLGGIAGNNVSKRQLEEIMSARLDDMFELVDEHLQKVNRSELLPAGIVMTGGGSGLPIIEDVARANLSLPSEVASVDIPKTKIIRELSDASWTVSYGTAVRAVRNQPNDLSAQLRNSRNTLLSWLGQFMP